MGAAASDLSVLPDLGLGHKASLTLGEEWAILDSRYSKKKNSLSDGDKWVSPNQKTGDFLRVIVLIWLLRGWALCDVFFFWFGEKE